MDKNLFFSVYFHFTPLNFIVEYVGSYWTGHNIENSNYKPGEREINWGTTILIVGSW